MGDGLHLKRRRQRERNNPRIAEYRNWKRQSRNFFRRDVGRALTLAIHHINQLELVVYEPSLFKRIKRLLLGIPEKRIVPELKEIYEKENREAADLGVSGESPDQLHSPQPNPSTEAVAS